MDVVIAGSSSAVRGTVSMPADKAICHRAALLAALSSSTVEIKPWATGDDCRRTLDVLQALGVGVAETSDGVRVQGAGLAGWRAPREALSCGDSGTTMRLLCGALAGQPFRAEVTGGPSLSQRPMRRIAEPLTAMGARVTGVSGAGQEVRPPLVIEGRRPLRGITHTLPVASAQVKSAILLAALFADGPTTVVEPSPTRDHTERLLHLSGVTLGREGHRLTLQPPVRLSVPARLAVPADPSSAAFFIVAACLLPGSRLVIPDVGLNPTRTAFLEVLKRMGASLAINLDADGWEPRGTVTATPSPLRGTTVTPAEVPQLIDEIPILMVAACAAEGTTRFEGVGELQVKETDRLRSMTDGLRALGADVTVEVAGPAAGDTPSAAGTVPPRSPSTTVIVRPSRLHGGVVDSFGDHRTAMSLAVAGLAATGATRVQGAECVRKSLENFFELLTDLTTTGTVKVIDNA